jgi:hypothetical protein
MSITQLAETISQLSTDSLWELAKELNTNHAVPALIFKADLEFAEWEKAVTEAETV